MIAKNVKEVSARVLVSVEPVETGSPDDDIRVQGNWPSDTEYGFTFVKFDKDGKHEASGLEYFLSKEDMDDRIEEYSSYCQMREVAYVLKIYEWDLGPNFVGYKTVFC